MSAGPSEIEPFIEEKKQHVDLDMEPFFLIFSRFVRRSDGAVDFDAERRFMTSRSRQLRIVFVNACYAMAVLSIGLVIFKLQQRPAICAWNVALIAAPFYLFCGLLAHLTDICYGRCSHVLILVLSFQSLVISYAAWQGSASGLYEVYGLQLMHIGFLQNFTPFGEATVHVLTFLLCVIPSVFSQMLAEVASLETLSDLSVCEVDQHAFDGETHRWNLAVGIWTLSVAAFIQVAVTQKRERFARQSFIMRDMLFEERARLHSEMQRLDAGLKAILPAHIVEGLVRNMPITQRETLDDCSVIFVKACYFEDHEQSRFQDISDSLEPEKLIHFFNLWHIACDELAREFNIFSVEKVGLDSMWASGGPHPRADHADAAVFFALRLSRDLHTLMLDGMQLTVRVGINSGPLETSIVGSAPPAYKLMGDTVNTAWRMVESCDPGRIQLSPSTRERLTPVFQLERGSSIPITGNGVLYPFFVNGLIDEENGIEYVLEQSPQRDLKGEGLLAAPSQHEGSEVAVPTSLKPLDRIIKSVPSLSLNFARDTLKYDMHGAPLRQFDSCYTDVLVRGLFPLYCWRHACGMQSHDMIKPFTLKGMRGARRAFTCKLVVVWLISLTCLNMSTGASVWDASLRSADFYALDQAIGLLYLLLLLTSSSLWCNYESELTLLILVAQAALVIVRSSIASNEEVFRFLAMVMCGSYVLLHTACNIHARFVICISLSVSYAVVAEVRSGHNARLFVAMLCVFWISLTYGEGVSEEFEYMAYHGHRLLTQATSEVCEIRDARKKLLALLIPPYAVELLDMGVTVEKHEGVTLLYTEIKGFTAFCSRLPPAELVDALNTLHCTLYEITAQAELQLVDITGDCCLVSAGCPGPKVAGQSQERALQEHRSKYAFRAIEVSLAMIRAIPETFDATLALTAGIHTGPVIAAITETNRPQYALFGSTVSWASKMSYHGEVNKVHVSNSTRDLIMFGTSGSECIWETRKVNVGGSGMEPTWLVQLKPRSPPGWLTRINEAIAVGDEEAIADAKADALKSGAVSEDEVKQKMAAEEKRQSESSGISAAYLVSRGLRDLACTMCGKTDPNFYEIHDAFFCGLHTLGSDARCPRDGRLGCALLDFLPRRFRGKCTHFVSWTWGYSISMVQETIQAWLEKEGLDPEQVFLCMDFFVNNPYRTMVDGEDDSAKNLEDKLKARLKSIGRMVAMLDTWEQPRYLTRIWTIFEQFTAVKLEIPVVMIMPQSSNKSLVQEIEKGREGIDLLIKQFTQIDSEFAEARSEKEKEQIQELMACTGGLEDVNNAVAKSMAKLIAAEVSRHFGKLAEAALAVAQSGIPRGIAELHRPKWLPGAISDLVHTATPGNERTASNSESGAAGVLCNLNCHRAQVPERQRWKL